MQDPYTLIGAKIQDIAFFGEDKIVLKLRKGSKIYELIIEYNEEHESDRIQRPLSIYVNELEEIKSGTRILIDALERLKEVNEKTFVDTAWIGENAILVEDWGNAYYILLRNGLELIVSKEEDNIIVKSASR